MSHVQRAPAPVPIPNGSGPECVLGPVWSRSDPWPGPVPLIQPAGPAKFDTPDLKTLPRPRVPQTGGTDASCLV